MTTIGIDVGGTKIAAGVVSFPEGRLTVQKTIPTAAHRGGRPVLEDVIRLVQDLQNLSGGEKIDGIGLGLCELVDPTGRILSANAVQWLDQPVTEALSKMAPTVIEADVRAAALAEAMFGAGRGYHAFLYVTVGTGISCCLMIEGKAFLGARGLTGTMASSPLTVRCVACGQVHQATVEEISSGPALVSRFQQRGGRAASGTDVLTAALSGDATAIEVVNTAAETLGANVGLLVNVLDPDAVILGGGLGSSRGLYWEKLVTSTRAHVWSEMNRDLPIAQAATGPLAGVLGAATAAWKQLS